MWSGDRQHPQLMSNEWDTVHARLQREDKHNRIVPSQFDTVLIDNGTSAANYSGIEGYIVGQVKVIFSLSDTIIGYYLTTNQLLPCWLAYIE